MASRSATQDAGLSGMMVSRESQRRVRRLWTALFLFLACPALCPPATADIHIAPLPHPAEIPPYDAFLLDETGIGAPPWGRPGASRALLARDDLLPSREHETLSRARNLIRAGFPEEGETLLRELTEQTGEGRITRMAYLCWGESLVRRDQPAAAAEVFARAAALWDGPEGRWRIQLWEAMARVQAGDTRAAAQLLEVAARDAPPRTRLRAEMLRWSGWLRVREREERQALGAWQAALEDAAPYGGLSDSLRIDLAEGFFASGEWERVGALLAAPPAEPPEPVRWHFLKGRAHFELGAFDSARIALAEIIAPESEATRTWRDEAREILGWLALREGDTETALEHYGEVIGLRQSDRAPSVYGSALALIAEGRYAEADELVSPAPQVPAGSELYYPWVYAIAYTRFHLERYAESLESLELFYGHTGADTLVRAAWSLRGDCHYRTGQANEAYAAYTKASSMFTEVPELLLRRQALAAIASGRWGTAARLLGDLVVKFPGTGHAGEYHFWRAESFYRLGRMEMARRHYRRAAQHGAGAVQCAYALGWCDYEEGRFENALDQFDRARRLCQGCSFEADIHLRRGNCLFNIGRIAEAAEAFSIAVALAQVDSLGLGREAAFRQAWTLLRLEDFIGAEAAFAEIREREGTTPLGAKALYWEGQAIFRREEFGPALARFVAVLEHPGAPDTLRTLTLLAAGDACFNAGEYDQALEWYRRILEAPAASRKLRQTAHESLYECRVLREEWDQARAVLRDLEAGFPESKGLGEKHHQLAEGLYRERRYTDALEAYADFLERSDAADPRQLQVRFRMARCREELGQRSQAAAAYEALGSQEGFRRRSDALLRAGVLRLDLGEAREALRPLELRLTLALDPSQDALTRAYLAEAYDHLGEREAARNEWEKVVHGGSGAPDSLRAMGSLQLGRMAFREREWDAAYRNFSAADSLGLAGEIYRPSYWAGEAAYQVSDTLAAVRHLEHFVAQGESEPLWEATARIRLAECYEGLGRKEDALEQYRTVIALPLTEEGLLQEARRRMVLLGELPQRPEADEEGER